METHIRCMQEVMSITGSLLTYENNINVSKTSKKRISLFHSTNFSSNATSNIKAISMGKTLHSSLNSSISNTGLNDSSSHNKHQHQHTNFQHKQLPTKFMNSKRKHTKYNSMYSQIYPEHSNYLHLNSLWSIWYGVLLTLFQGYLAVHGAYRFLGCSLIAWKIEPVAELNSQIILSGLVFVLLPFFFTSAVFKVGNIANDGIKLTSTVKERRCSMLPPDGLEDDSGSGSLQTLWTHGGPTAAFIHIVVAICLLLPRLLLEARIIENGLLPRETIWQTELDFMAVNRRNLVILSVIASPYQNNSLFQLHEDEDFFNDTIFAANSSFGTNGNNLLRENSKQKEQGLIKKTRTTEYLEISNLLDIHNSENQPLIQLGDKLILTNTTIESSKMKVHSDLNEFYSDENEYSIQNNLNKKRLMSMNSETQNTATQNYVKNSGYEETTISSLFSSEMSKQRLSTENGYNNISLTNTYSMTPMTIVNTTSSSYNLFNVLLPNSNNVNVSIIPTPSHESHNVPHPSHHYVKSTRKHQRKGKLHSNFAKHKNHYEHHIENTPANRLEDLKFSRNSKSDESIEQSIELHNVNKPKLSFTSLGGKVFEHRPTLYEELDYERPRTTIFAKSSTTISTTTRDSNIHIVRPEKLPEIIPSTPLSSNSKIIEIKPNKNKIVKRAISEENLVKIEPEYLTDDLHLNNSNEYIAEVNNPMISSAVSDVQSAESEMVVVRLDGFAGMLQIFFGIEKQIDVNVFNHPPSAEFINLLFALLVWSVRYPAVFWTTTKSFATIFSVQMIAAAADIIFSYVGISSLFKLQIYSQLQPIQNLGLILNASVTLALFLLSVLLILSSSMVMYLYGHGRLSAKVRDRSIISFKSNESWIYFAHCASLCYILSLAVVKAPLLNDLSAAYRSNFHCPTFMAALVSVMHIFLWIIIWIGLTVKRNWNFKLPPLDAYAIIGKTTTQPLLLHNRGSSTNTVATSFNNSTAIGLSNTSASDNMELKINCDNPGKLSSETSSSNILNDEASNDIYWPKIGPSSPKLKVTFNEVTSTSDDDHHQLMGDHEQNDGKRNSPRGSSLCFTSVEGETDDGEYATLRSTPGAIVGIDLSNDISKEANNFPISYGNSLHLSEYNELPPPPPAQMVSSMTITSHTTTVTINPDYVNCSGGSVGRLVDDNISEEGKLLACVRDDSVTYASTCDIEPPLPPPPSQPTDLNSKTNNSMMVKRMPQTMAGTAISPLSQDLCINPMIRGFGQTNETYITSSSTSRSLRRADSGVPHEALTPRSDSTSSGNDSTTSPPERAPSESSSGIHSAEEKDNEVVIRSRIMSKPFSKLPPPAIQEEPYGRSTNMRMSSFAGINSNSSTLPLLRSNVEQKIDYSQHCSTMPLPFNNNHSQQQTQSAVYATSAQCMSQSQNTTTNLTSFKTPLYANSGVAISGHNPIQKSDCKQHRRPPPPPPSPITHIILANGVRYSNPSILRRSPYIKSVESAYSHQTLSKNSHENTQSNANTSKDRDSANYSMNSDQDYFYATSNGLH